MHRRLGGKKNECFERLLQSLACGGPSNFFKFPPSNQAVQVLRLGTLWGPQSTISPEDVTHWTAQGWLCRVYLTVALGIFAPLTAWLTAFTLAAAAPSKRG